MPVSGASPSVEVSREHADNPGTNAAVRIRVDAQRTPFGRVPLIALMSKSYFLAGCPTDSWHLFGA
jgi:hypothetical protein